MFFSSVRKLGLLFNVFYFFQLETKHAKDILKLTNKLKTADLKEDYLKLQSALVYTFSFVEEIGKLYEQMSQQVNISFKFESSLGISGYKLRGFVKKH